MNKKKNFLVVFSFLVVLAGSLVFSGCETSRVGPEAPRPNPPAPTPQAVVLSGYVLDNTTGNGIANATVSLVKLDGTVVATAATNGSGMYQFNLTALNLSESTFNISTNVAGFGYGFRTATYDKANGVASVVPLVLTKITNVTTTTIGTSGGTATVPPTSDAKTSTPVTVTVPANAVPANTQVTVASVPVVSTPPPSTTAATQNIVASNNLSAPGVTTFAQPVTMTFNLPFPLPAGTQIPLLLFNTATNKWENTGSNAVVAAGGLTASVQVTKPGQYALLGNVSVSQTVTGKYVQGEGISITKMEKVLGTKELIIELGPNNKTSVYDGSDPTPPYITVVSGDANNQPTQPFTYGLIQARFGRSNQTGQRARYYFTYNLPAMLGGSPTVNSAGLVQGPAGHETESGDWIYRIRIEELSINDVFRVSQTGVFIQDANFMRYRHNFIYEWYWRQHNQGGVGVGPF